VVTQRLKPFENLEDRSKLVRVYLSQFLKDIDEKHLEVLKQSPGANNPLYLKIVLSELRVFGAFSNLEKKIRDDFGNTPVSAFNGLLKRLETDPTYSLIDPKQAVPSETPRHN
jgi:nephrocystin-3